MTKVKPMKKIVRSYVLSTAKAIINYRDYLVEKKGFQDDYAMKKAVKYGVNMLNAGLGKIFTPQDAAIGFRELAEVCIALADFCISQTLVRP